MREFCGELVPRRDNCEWEGEQLCLQMRVVEWGFAVALFATCGCLRIAEWQPGFFAGAGANELCEGSHGTNGNWLLEEGEGFGTVKRKRGKDGNCAANT